MYIVKLFNMQNDNLIIDMRYAHDVHKAINIAAMFVDSFDYDYQETDITKNNTLLYASIRDDAVIARATISKADCEENFMTVDQIVRRALYKAEAESIN